MNITLRQLQVFVTIAQSGSTTAAGDKIALSQSAISASIGELERSLNIKLFDRVGKRLRLNDHGRSMMPQALSLLNSAESLEEQYLHNAPSLLIIGASLTIGNYLLPKLLSEYWRSQGISLGDCHPPIQAVVANTADIVAKVINFDVDIGLIEGPCHSPEVSVTPWIEDELLLVASPKHPIFQEFRHTLIPLNRLASTNWLLRERGSGTREALEHTLLPHLAQIKSCLEFNDHEAIQQSTAQGLGIAYLSKLVVSDMLISGHLVELNTVFGRLNRRFSLLTHHQKQITSGMQRFIDYSINTMPINVEI